MGLLSVVGCDGAPTFLVPLSWDNGRWTGKLDTSRLAGPGCYRATVSLDGNAAGSFRLELRGDATSAKGPTKAPATVVTTRHPIAVAIKHETKTRQEIKAKHSR